MADVVKPKYTAAQVRGYIGNLTGAINANTDGCYADTLDLSSAHAIREIMREYAAQLDKETE